MGRLQFRSIQWIGYAGQKIVLPAKLPCHVFMLRLLSFLFFMSTPISFLNPSGVVICRYADDIILFLKDDKYVGNFKSTRLKQWLGWRPIWKEKKWGAFDRRWLWFPLFLLVKWRTSLDRSRALDHPALTVNDSILQWWTSCQLCIPPKLRKGVNSVVISLLWCIWLERSRHVFKHTSLLPSAVVDRVIDHCREWWMIGNNSLRRVVP